MHHFKGRLSAIAVFAALGFAAAPAFAAGTAANTNIQNTASATFTNPVTNAQQTVSSNTTSLLVDEILNVTVASNNPGPVSAASPGTGTVLSFTVTNTGNGVEPYALSVNPALGGDNYNPTNAAIYLDTNGNGTYDSGVDVQYVPGTSPNPSLNPDQALVVFVVADTPAGQANGNTALVSLSAAAVTGTGPAGTTFNGAGTGGVTAVTGTTTATQSANGTYVVSQVATTLTKSQTVLDPNGAANAIPGAVITYSLVFGVTGSGVVNSAQITDAIPANTTYVPGSLTLDTAALTDATDVDAGRASSAGIQVGLGNVTAPATRTVTFRVRIN